MKTPVKTIYICWVDDIAGFVNSYEGKFELLEAEYAVKFHIDEHNHTRDFDTIARAVEDDGNLIFLIDYNLKGHDGQGMDGDALIKMIRDHNKNCPIVFYSSKATQSELRGLVKDLSLVVCVLRETLQEILSDIASGQFNDKLKKS